GREWVEGRGGKLVLFPYREGKSTTLLIERIRAGGLAICPSRTFSPDCHLKIGFVRDVDVKGSDGAGYHFDRIDDPPEIRPTGIQEGFFLNKDTVFSSWQTHLIVSE
ncbi:MAG TPA: hypothetical protein PKK12_05205, partial [Candidatus Aminicenantes bacterium]|nr:hypothetical protein [Candidatus Aminicenantes bacterium]